MIGADQKSRRKRAASERASTPQAEVTTECGPCGENPIHSREQGSHALPGIATVGNMYGRSSPYFVPHNLYYDLRGGTFSPSIYQFVAFSRITGYRLSDWLRVFGADLENIARFQVSLSSSRTILLDSSLADSDAWVPWFRNRVGNVPVPRLRRSGSCWNYLVPSDFVPCQRRENEVSYMQRSDTKMRWHSRSAPGKHRTREPKHAGRTVLRANGISSRIPHRAPQRFLLLPPARHWRQCHRAGQYTTLLR